MNDLHLYTKKFLTFRFAASDIPSGLVVFLVALPLCLGIALASGAPLLAGLVTGIVGGLVVSVLSGSQLSVSGPAAGLTVIVLNAITTLGSFEAFLLAVMLAGAIQLGLGLLKAGSVANYFPTAVIKGMLAAIGIILILKQLPYALGHKGNLGEDFGSLLAMEMSFSELMGQFSPGVIIISAFAVLVMIVWPMLPLGKLKIIPGALIAVLGGILINSLLAGTGLEFDKSHMVSIPVLGSLADAKSVIHFPDFSQFGNPAIYTTALTLAIVASLETLLSLEAVEKLDPLKRYASQDKELRAQGIGNMVAGLLGGLPMTAVIVRSSANVQSGGKTKLSSFTHGIFLLSALLLIPGLINEIPLAALAAILLVTGYKLTKPALFKDMYKAGKEQFVPFLVTLVAIVTTDMLKGIAVGMAVSAFFILRRNMRNPYYFHKEQYKANEPVRIVLSEDVSFLNKASILTTLEEIPDNTRVVIDGSNTLYVDYDVLEVIENFRENAIHRDIEVELINIQPSYKVLQH